MKMKLPGEYAWTLIFGVAGAMIGFGWYGTAQGAAIGGGIGLVSIPAVLVALIVVEYIF